MLNLDELARTLTRKYGDVWLKALRGVAVTGVADREQIGQMTALTGSKVKRFLEHCTALTNDTLLPKLSFTLHRPDERGAGRNIYRLGETGAALLRKHGASQAHPCELNTALTVAHAYAMQRVHLAAQAAGLTVVTDKPFPYGQQQVLRPDHCITLPASVTALFEVEQHVTMSHLGRIVESLRHKVAFFQSKAGRAVAPTVRVLFNVANAEWESTLAVWEKGTRTVAREYHDSLPFAIVARPLADFLADPDWAEPPAHPQWRSLFDPAQTASFAGKGASDSGPVRATHRPDLPADVCRYTPEQQHCVLLAYAEHIALHGLETITAQAAPLFFDMMQVIYAASHPLDATPWQSAQYPRESLYLLEQYLILHPALHTALRSALQRGAKTMRWSTPVILHRMQTVIGRFLEYHGLAVGPTLDVYPVMPGTPRRNETEFRVVAQLHPEVLMGQTSGVVPPPEQVAAAEDALAWVCYALFAYAEALHLPPPDFW